MYIVSSFMQNLNNMFPDADASGLFGITSRLVYTIVMNSVLFGAMLLLLGLQIYHENLDENKPEYFKAWEAESDDELYYVSHIAAYMITATIIVPILSIVVFVLANYYYILELMIKINVHVLKNSALRSTLEEYGDVAQGIMGFAKTNVHATPGRLRDIQSLSTFQRVFYVLREWWIDLIFFIWSVIISLYCYFYYEYSSKTQVTGTFYIVYLVTFLTCVMLFAFANYHTFAIVLITNILMLPMLLSFAGQALVDKCKSLKSGRIAAEKNVIARFQNASNNPTITETDKP